MDGSRLALGATRTENASPASGGRAPRAPDRRRHRRCDDLVDQASPTRVRCPKSGPRSGRGNRWTGDVVGFRERDWLGTSEPELQSKAERYSRRNHARRELCSPVLVLSASVVGSRRRRRSRSSIRTKPGSRRRSSARSASRRPAIPKLASDFNRAVALLHSFWFGASAAAFTAIAEKDPSCGIAWWGVAMSRWGNPFAPARPPAALKEGRDGDCQGPARPAQKRDRERDLIEAAATLFTDFETVDQRTRTVNYEQRHGAGRTSRTRRTTEVGGVLRARRSTRRRCRPTRPTPSS